MSHNNTAIKVEGVSKKFVRNLGKSIKYGAIDISRNLIGLSSNSEKLRKGEFWAVDNVSFEVKRGENIGIIGPNGAGKTTMLKMLNGIFMPDKGNITIKGKMGALIQVGAGFHPQLTGRENIYVNGAILGMRKKEIDQKYDSIIDFADIGEFIDSPVKFYSSGMFVRLGFSVAVHCNPEILLVDEILAVGDKEFQIKCYQKMHEVMKSGTTIVLVSHNEYTIREQTSRIIYLNNGKMIYSGPTEDGINLYLKEMYESKKVTINQEVIKKPKLSNKAELLSLNFFDINHKQISYIESGQELNIELELIIKEQLDEPILGVNFYGSGGFFYCANSEYEKIHFQPLPLGPVLIKIKIPNFYLPDDKYVCSTTLSEATTANLIDWEDMKYTIIVGKAESTRGSLKLPTKWEIG